MVVLLQQTKFKNNFETEKIFQKTYLTFALFEYPFMKIVFVHKFSEEILLVRLLLSIVFATDFFSELLTLSIERRMRAEFLLPFNRAYPQTSDFF